MNRTVQHGCTTVDAMAPRAIPAALETHKAVQAPLRRLRAAEARLEEAVAHHQQTRRAVVGELLAAGLSYAQVGQLLGLTKSRVFQLARGTR